MPPALEGLAGIHLVRHGESTWNALGLLQGRTPDIPLTTAGIRQAHRAGVELATARIRTIWSSPQLRAAQTAHIIERLTGAAVSFSPDLAEQGHGAWEGRPASVYGPLLHAAGSGWRPPGGESIDAVLTRARRFLYAVETSEPIAVVSHGDTIRCLMAAALGLAPHAVSPRTVTNGAIIPLDRSSRTPRPATRSAPATPPGC
jgi:probable phosphoglycerate mutase